jgi:phosphoribosyl-AMP cyclohydrolase
MDKKTIEEGAGFSPGFERRNGLLPVIVQSARDRRILMLAYANQTALGETMKTGLATFWSTSRNELWRKGDTSGDRLKVVDILVDCDQDALIYLVELGGEGACHTKDPATQKARLSCFYRKIDFKTGKLAPFDSRIT